MNETQAKYNRLTTPLWAINLKETDLVYFLFFII